MRYPSPAQKAGVSRTTQVKLPIWLETALSALPIGVSVADATQSDLPLMYVNDAFEQITGYSRAEVMGKNGRFLQGPYTQQEELGAVRRALTGGTPCHVVLQNVRKDGRIFWNQLSLVPIRGGDGQLRYFLGIQQDVTALREAEHRVQSERERWVQVAHTDALTRLPNRAAAEHLLAEKAQMRDRGIIGILDCDDLKWVNDTFGHDAGDRVLRSVARRLRRALAPGDFVARWGGDEFLIVAASVTDDGRLSAWVDRLRRLIQHPIRLGDRLERLTISLGLAWLPDAGWIEADVALSLAKRHKWEENTPWWKVWDVKTTPAERSLPLPMTSGVDDVEGKTLMARANEILAEEAGRFVDAFYAGLASEPEPTRILTYLTPEEFTRLKGRQIEYLRTLLDPAVRDADHDRQAHTVGERHALVGVRPEWLVQAMVLYGMMVTMAIQRLRLPPAAVHRLQNVIWVRLAKDLEGQLQGAREIAQEREQLVVALSSEVARNPDPAQWAKTVLRRIATLTGIVAASLGRPDEDGQFVFEYHAGQRREADESLARVISDAQASIEPTVRAWNSGVVATVAHVGQDAASMGSWGRRALACGIRSIIAVPVRDHQSGQSEAVLTVFGEYPGQFEDSRIKSQFALMAQILDAGWSTGEKGKNAWERYRLRRYLNEDALMMVYQPIVSLTRGTVDMVEALARICPKGHECWTPGMFLPGLGDAELDQLFVLGLDQTLQQFRQWIAGGWRGSVTVNVPPAVAQRAAFPTWVERALTRADIDPNRLWLELLETPEDAHFAQIQRQLVEVASWGVHWVLDDFGSGWSNVQRLQEGPFEMVKIDQRLVLPAIEHPQRNLALIGSVINLAHGLDLPVVVEGLETRALLEMAKQLGAEWGQGFVIGRPAAVNGAHLPHVPDTEIREWLDKVSTPLGLGAAHWVWEQGCQPESAVCSYFDQGTALEAAHRAVHETVQGRQSTVWRQRRAQFYHLIAEACRSEMVGER